MPPELNVTQTGNDKAQRVPLTPEQQAILAAGSVQQGEAVSSTGNEKVVFDANGKPVVVASKDMTEQQASNLVQQQTSAQAPAQIDWNSPSAQAAHTEATVNATTQAAVNGQVVAQGVQPQTMQGAEVIAGAEALTASAALQQGLSGDAEAVPVKRITLDELHIIDTKLAQGKPLSKQETDVIEGLKTGELVADIPEQDLAQFVALPSDVKAAMVEHQSTLRLVLQHQQWRLSKHIILLLRTLNTQPHKPLRSQPWRPTLIKLLCQPCQKLWLLQT